MNDQIPPHLRAHMLEAAPSVLTTEAPAPRPALCQSCPHPNACRLAVKECPYLPPAPTIAALQRKLIPAESRVMNPWHPMTAPIDLKVLGKLQEELGEIQEVLARLQTALARCVIQGVGGLEPVTGKSNKVWLEEEIADVEAGLELAKERLLLDRLFIIKRAARKRKQLKTWHEM